MKLRYTLLPIILFTLFTVKVSGQTTKPCYDFDCAYKKAESLLNASKYQSALDNLDSAEGYLTDKNTKEKEQIKQLRRRLFNKVEEEKEKAKKQTDIAKKALAQVEIEKQAAIAEKIKAEVAEANTKVALLKSDSLFNVAEVQRKKANAVLDKIYFYDDKFGLAYDKSAHDYGFIDKDLKTKIDFKYDEALPFDGDGFAKVKRNGDFNLFNYNEVYHLIDTAGREYKLSTNLEQLDSSTTALDLQNTSLKEIPRSVFKHKQLKILLLNFNRLNSLSPEIGKLTNLMNLSLRYNELTNLPPEIGKLAQLTSLDLGYNQLTNLSPEIGKLTNLTALYLYLNQLTNLPPEIGKLTNLTKLNLYSNNLTTLPPEIGKLTNLTFLVLHGNQLTTLPPEIENLTNLTYMQLGGNPISAEEQEKIKKLLPICKIEF